jgi:hypothetical protein
MIVDPHRFWRDGDCVNPPLTDEAISFAEGHFGKKLPDGYLDLIRIQNGGYIHPLEFPTSHLVQDKEVYVELHDLAGIVPGSDELQNIMMTDYMTSEWGLPPDQILLAGEGHWWISLDYRKGPIPCVTRLDADNEVELILAPTFDAFLAGLQPHSITDSQEG